MRNGEADSIEFCRSEVSARYLVSIPRQYGKEKGVGGWEGLTVVLRSLVDRLLHVSQVHGHSIRIEVDGACQRVELLVVSRPEVGEVNVPEMLQLDDHSAE
jgi:hypothetical protein